MSAGSEVALRPAVGSLVYIWSQVVLRWLVVGVVVVGLEVVILGDMGIIGSSIVRTLDTRSPGWRAAHCIQLSALRPGWSSPSTRAPRCSGPGCCRYSLLHSFSDNKLLTFID